MFRFGIEFEYIFACFSHEVSAPKPVQKPVSGGSGFVVGKEPHSIFGEFFKDLLGGGQPKVFFEFFGVRRSLMCPDKRNEIPVGPNRNIHAKTNELFSAGDSDELAVIGYKWF